MTAIRPQAKPYMCILAQRRDDSEAWANYSKLETQQRRKHLRSNWTRALYMNALMRAVNTHILARTNLDNDWPSIRFHKENTLQCCESNSDLCICKEITSDPDSERWIPLIDSHTIFGRFGWGFAVAKLKTNKESRDVAHLYFLPSPLQDHQCQCLLIISTVLTPFWAVA